MKVWYQAIFWYQLLLDSQHMHGCAISKEGKFGDKTSCCMTRRHSALKEHPTTKASPEFSLESSADKNDALPHCFIFGGERDDIFDPPGQAKKSQILFLLSCRYCRVLCHSCALAKCVSWYTRNRSSCSIWSGCSHWFRVRDGTPRAICAWNGAHTRVQWFYSHWFLESMTERFWRVWSKHGLVAQRGLTFQATFPFLTKRFVCTNSKKMYKTGNVSSRLVCAVAEWFFLQPENWVQWNYRNDFLPCTWIRKVWMARKEEEKTRQKTSCALHKWIELMCESWCSANQSAYQIRHCDLWCTWRYMSVSTSHSTSHLAWPPIHTGCAGAYARRYARSVCGSKFAVFGALRLFWVCITHACSDTVRNIVRECVARNRVWVLTPKIWLRDSQ